MTEHTVAKNSLLNSYLIINQLLEMDFKSKYYRELKNRLTNEELEVVKYLQHNRSQEKLKAKKENNLDVNSSRGRKNKQTDTVPSDENIQQNEQPSVEETAPQEELPQSQQSWNDSNVGIIQQSSVSCATCCFVDIVHVCVFNMIQTGITWD